MSLAETRAPETSAAVIETGHSDTEQFEESWRAWREQSETGRRDPYGFLSYAAVYKLASTPQRFPDVPGEWVTGVEGAVVDLRGAEQLFVDDEPVTGRHVFADVTEREFRRAARFGETIIELSRRGGIVLLRPIDPGHGLRDSYVETPAYEPNADWIIQGEFVPFDHPRDTAIDAAIEGITHRHDAVGEVVFTLDGVENRLLFLSGGPKGGAFAVFTDATSGVTTYRASRRLFQVLPETAGPVALDFNRTGNLQCAYTDFSPCPLAPAQNRLTVAIEAGEKTPIFTS
jgi:uncharacterized protein (DUF1684 family)